MKTLSPGSLGICGSGRSYAVGYGTVLKEEILNARCPPVTALQFPVTYQEVGSDIKRCHTLFSSKAFEVQRLGPKTTPHRPCSANPSTDDSSSGSRAQYFNRFPSYIPDFLSSHWFSRFDFDFTHIPPSFHVRFRLPVGYHMRYLEFTYNIMGFIRFPTFIFCACVRFTYSCKILKNTGARPRMEVMEHARTCKINLPSANATSLV